MSKGSISSKRPVGYEVASDIFASGAAAILSKTVVAPIERLKLFYQVQRVHPGSSHFRYSSASDFFRRCTREQGFSSLWRGNLANVLRYLPVQSLNFVFNNRFKPFFARLLPREQRLAVGLLSGGFAGAASLTVVYPLDFARTRMAVDIGGSAADREFTGLSHCFKKTFHVSGLRGFYRGYTAGVVCYFVYRGCYFGFYEYAKRSVSDDPYRMNLALRFCVAEVVSLVSQSIAYPFDTVRRRMMLQNPDGGALYSSVTRCWIRTLVTEGPAAFYAGLGVNVFRSLGSALMLTLYDEFSEVLRSLYVEP